MFNRYFGKKVEYKEVFVNEQGDLEYKDPVLIDGSLNEHKELFLSTWLNNKFTKYSNTYRVNKVLNLGDMIDGGKVYSCVPRGFGSRTDYYEVKTTKYSDLLFTHDDLTMTCMIERIVGYSELNKSPIYSPAEEVKTFMLGQKEIFRHRGDGEIEAVNANGYLFLQSMNIKSGDRIDGYIVTEVVEHPSINGSIAYKEAFVCK